MSQVWWIAVENAIKNPIGKILIVCCWIVSIRVSFNEISFRFNSLQLLDFCVVKLIFFGNRRVTMRKRRIFYKYFKIILLMESFVFNILLGAVFESMNDKFVSDPTLVFKRIQSREVKLSKMLRSIGGLVS